MGPEDQFHGAVPLLNSGLEHLSLSTCSGFFEQGKMVDINKWAFQ